MSNSTLQEILRELAKLSPSQQQDLLGYIRRLQPQLTKEHRQKILLDLATSFPPEDVKDMKAAIEEAFPILQ